MRRKSCFLFLISFYYFICHAQKPDEILNRWADESPIEKIHLHIDRDIYMAGETIWYKAYLYSDFLPDTISTSLYVELLDAPSHIVSRKIVPVLFYTARGQIELSDSLPAGSYFIRAYSPTMLNQYPVFIYHHSIFIFSKKIALQKRSNQKKNLFGLNFFPKGETLSMDWKIQ